MRLFLAKLVRTFIVFLIGMLPKPSVRYDPMLPDDGTERVSPCVVKDRYSRLRLRLWGILMRCIGYIHTKEDERYLRSLVPTRDERGILLFPFNISSRDRDRVFYVWNRLAGTMARLPKNTLTAEEMDGIIDGVRMDLFEKQETLRRLRAAKSKMLGSCKFVYNVVRDEVLPRW